jgi:hypothetical protein
MPLKAIKKLAGTTLKGVVVSDVFDGIFLLCRGKSDG